MMRPLHLFSFIISILVLVMNRRSAGASEMQHYDNDFLRAKSKVLQVVEEANRYLIQLNTALTVLDVLPMMRSDFSLYTFQEFRNQRLAKLPEHDFSVLFSFKYAGGLAFVDGMCSPQSVMLCGFFPQDPRAMGGIFFHEIAHLLGVPHKSQNSSVYVPNCDCPSQERLKRSIDPSNAVVNEPGCLKIPGFDHDCTAQQFVNYLHKSRCVRTDPFPFMRSTPICGNGVLEEGEQCDCGIPETCSRLNCIPELCAYRIHPAWLWFLSLVLVFVIFFLFSWILHRRGLVEMFSSCYKKRRPKASAYASTLLTDDLLHSPYSLQKAHLSPAGTSTANSYTTTKVQENGSVLVLERPPRTIGVASTGTMQRPRQPPPPPPKTSISVQQTSSHYGYEIPIKRQTGDSKPEADSISWKFDSFDSDDDIIPVPSETGVPCRPNYPPTVPINRITVSAIHSSGDTLSTDCSPSSSSSNDAKL